MCLNVVDCTTTIVVSESALYCLPVLIAPCDSYTVTDHSFGALTATASERSRLCVAGWIIIPPQNDSHGLSNLTSPKSQGLVGDVSFDLCNISNKLSLGFHESSFSRHVLQADVLHPPFYCILTSQTNRELLFLCTDYCLSVAHSMVCTLELFTPSSTVV